MTFTTAVNNTRTPLRIWRAGKPAEVYYVGPDLKVMYDNARNIHAIPDALDLVQTDWVAKYEPGVQP
jgi:hypothetical protein